MVKGFDALLDRVISTLAELPHTYEFEEEQLVEAPEYEDGFTIDMDGEVFVVSGGTIDRLLDTTYADDPDSMRRFQQILIKEGVIQTLRDKGAGEGSIVRMGEWEFDFAD